jgi:hypothetical protein
MILFSPGHRLTRGCWALAAGAPAEPRPAARARPALRQQFDLSRPGGRAGLVSDLPRRHPHLPAAGAPDRGHRPRSAALRPDLPILRGHGHRRHQVPGQPSKRPVAGRLRLQLRHPAARDLPCRNRTGRSGSAVSCAGSRLAADRRSPAPISRPSSSSAWSGIHPPPIFCGISCANTPSPIHGSRKRSPITAIRRTSSFSNRSPARPLILRSETFSSA